MLGPVDLEAAHDHLGAVEGSSETSKSVFKLNRRSFLVSSAAIAGGMMLEVSVPFGAAKAQVGPSSSNVEAGKVTLIIGSDDAITLIVPGAEMGQGINSALAQVFAEELPLYFPHVKTIPAPFNAQYADARGSQMTFGSTGMKRFYASMLIAGATARTKLIEAAARKAVVDRSLVYETVITQLSAVSGNGTLKNRIQHTDGWSYSYGELAAAAATIAVNATPQLNTNNAGYQNNYIGMDLVRTDIREKVNGQAKYGLDMWLDGMVFAAIRHAPSIGSTALSVGAAPSGIRAVNLGSAIAAVSTRNSWAAMKAVNALKVTWSTLSTSAQNLVDTTAQRSNLTTLLSSTSAAKAEASPDTTTPDTTASTGVLAPVQGGIRLDLAYSYPMLAHASMEVLNCTVKLTWSGGVVTRADIWCPTQGPDSVAAVVAGLLPQLTKDVAGKKVPDPDLISVTATYLGGGFGRKIELDYVNQAVRIAMELREPNPVKLMWWREEDFARDYCRPAALSRIQVVLDPAKKNSNTETAIKGWYNRIVAPSVIRSHGWTGTPRFSYVDGIAVGSAVGTGAEPMSYTGGAMAKRYVDYVEQETGFKLGFWRSVGQYISCFAVESAVDECARAMSVDPLQFRYNLLDLAGDTKMKSVLQDVVNLAGDAPAGTARGIAISPGFHSHCAMIIEMAKSGRSGTRISAIYCSVDCGIVVNPNQVKSQLEGGILQGLNAARWNQMTFARGVSQVKNFREYRIGQLANQPPIFIRIVENETATEPGGIGEVGVPPVAPALANAYAALTGIRKRSLPLGI